MLKVVHVIVGLESGGAENMLRRLVEAGRPALDSTVVSLTTVGTLGEALRSQGFRVEAMGMTSAWQLPAVLMRLAGLLRRLHPDAVQCWMYHADFVGGLAARLAGCGNIVWGLRSSAIPQNFPAPTWWLVRLNALLSHLVPHRIVCCADSALQAHAALGFARRKMVVIPNGFDFTGFVPSPLEREQIRQRLGWSAQTPVIGTVSRFDPLKDLPNFLDAAVRVKARVPGVRFLLVGRGLDDSNSELRRRVEQAGLKGEVSLAGEQRNVPAYLSAMDVFCLSSRSEGFPNVVVEAMAMDLPCVVTAAGDAAAIVGDTGTVVPVQDASALAQAMGDTLALPQDRRDALGQAAGRGVRERYGIDVALSRYLEQYRAHA
jgi:glycosyltransferase involved in cell wall biosynthesis